MEKLNNYLQQLLNTCGYELHLEPNKSPYIMTASGQVEASKNPLPGALINSMIFSLIPTDVKQQLPNQSEVEFIHPHNLGAFSFSVKKSPSGFNVVICPTTDAPSATEPPAAADVETPQVRTEVEAPAVRQDSAPAAQPDLSQPTQPETQPAPQTPTSMDTEVEADQEEEVYSPYGNRDYSDSELDDLQELEALDDPLSMEAEQPADVEEQYAPEEFPGSSGSYQSTYESPAVEVEVEGDESTYEIDYSEFSDPENEPAKSQPEIPLTPKAPENQAVSHANYAPESSAVEEPTQHETIVVEHTEPVDFSVQETVVQSESPTQTLEQEQPASHAPQQPVAAEQPVPAANTFTPASTGTHAEMDALFSKMAEFGASDLHLSVSMPPLVRKDGKMMELSPGAAPLTDESMKNLLTSIMPEKNQEEFEEKNDTDFAYEIPGLARFRANVFRDRKGIGGVFRVIPSDIMTAEDLNLSKAIMSLCELSKGLVVVTGPTGSGKSTTLCAMVDWINKNREDHIITIEDPIEFTHENQKCLVNQREVHNHTSSFKNALRAALREDPDIVLVGEMRDLETISIAIETAETGHLVFGTLHTTTAASTVDRIIDQFPADRQQQIRVMLSESLKGVIAQTLLPKKGGGRIAALETLIVTPAIANLIREGKTFQIPSQMQTGKNLGMVMLNDALMDLVNKGIVEPKDAYIKAVDKDGFEMLLQRNGKKV